MPRTPFWCRIESTLLLGCPYPRRGCRYVSSTRSGEKWRQRGHDRRVRGKPVDAVQLVYGEPPHLAVLDELRGFAVNEDRRVDPQHGPTMPERDIRADPRADPHRNAQFLDALADEGFHVGLPRLDFAPRKLPATSEFRWLGTGTRKNSATLDDRGSDDDARPWPFGLHEPSECQIFLEMYALPSLWLPDVGYVAIDRACRLRNTGSTKRNKRATTRPQASNGSLGGCHMTARWRTAPSADYLSDAFALLAGWRRDGMEINRTFPLDEAQHAALTERIAIIAEALQVRPRIRRCDGQTLIGLDSTETGELLPSEVHLAARIEDTYRTIAGLA
jgi:4a-hydroxytetrahydrobiopterin dehydratase